ncbi:adenosylmethionine decarboxylase [Myxococcota bacterium]|nr:adenosylmethionine decarboxylase [Myxococcota bacterium]
METVGRHIIVELYQCNREALNNKALIRSAMLQAVDIIGATALSEGFHEYDPQGVSGTIFLAESHISIHTWPEAGYAAVDIYTCGGLDPNPGFRILGDKLESKSFRKQEIVRGLPEELEAGKDVLPKDVQIISKITESETF